MKNTKLKHDKIVKGKGYVGVWSDGILGWSMPTHFSSYGKNRPKVEHWNEGAQVFLCEITLKPIKDKRGRYIIRYLKKD